MNNFARKPAVEPSSGFAREVNVHRRDGIEPTEDALARARRFFLILLQRIADTAPQNDRRELHWLARARLDVKRPPVDAIKHQTRKRRVAA